MALVLADRLRTSDRPAPVTLARLTGPILMLLATVLLLTGCGGTSKPTKGAQGSAADPWSTLDLTRTFDGGGVNVLDVSCTSGPFCMILGANATYSSWKTVTYASGTVGTATALPAGPGAVLACASSHFCLAYTPDVKPQTYDTWNGSGWTAHHVALGGTPSGSSLTCPSPGLCLAIGNSGQQGAATLLEYEPASLSEHVFPLPHGQFLTSIACASATDCYVLSNEGDVWKFTGYGGGFAGPTKLTVTDSRGASDPVTEIACAEGPYCLGLGTGGGVLADRGSGFAQLPGVTLMGAVGLANFSGGCGSASFCLVQKSGSGDWAVLDGTRLTVTPMPPAQPAGNFSCTADRFCMDDLATSSAKVILYDGA